MDATEPTIDDLVNQLKNPSFEEVKSAHRFGSSLEPREFWAITRAFRLRAMREKIRAATGPPPRIVELIQTANDPRLVRAGWRRAWWVFYLNAQSNDKITWPDGKLWGIRERRARELISIAAGRKTISQLQHEKLASVRRSRIRERGYGYTDGWNGELGEPEEPEME